MIRSLGALALFGAVALGVTGCATTEETTDVKAVQAEAQNNVPKDVPAMKPEDMAKIQQGQMGGPKKGGN